MSGRHYYILQKRTFMAVQKRIWENFINFAEKLKRSYMNQYIIFIWQ